MTQSKKDGTFEGAVNKVMGVKTPPQSNNTKKEFTQELDLKAIFTYISGTIIQIGLLILTFWILGKLITQINSLTVLPSWSGSLVAGVFFTFLSIRSRAFSPLDNTRSQKTYDSVVRPKWAPPPLAFPIIWLSIGVLRVISSMMAWQAMGQNFLVLPLIAFAIHLALGDTWNTIFTVECRLGAAVPVVIFGPWLSAIVVTYFYWEIVPQAGLILAPSCIWLSVAALLVISIWQLNGKEPWYPLKAKSSS